MSTPRGLPVVLSAASGTGKTTLSRRLLLSDPRLALSISYTTRQPRGQERNEVDYHFVDDATFSAMIARNAFVEWAEVFGNRYGTSAEKTEELLVRGVDVLFDIDVQGGEQLKKRFPETVLIFLIPPSMEVLATRLRGRQTDSAEVIERRLHAARGEIERGVRGYDYVVVNSDLARAEADLVAIVRAERQRRHVDREQLLHSLLSGSTLG
ncbi:MAG: guanylate kinase [Myxococcota bacterium]